MDETAKPNLLPEPGPNNGNTFQEMAEGLAQFEILCNEQGHPVDGRILSWNLAAERLTGRRADQVLGKTILELRPETDRRLIEVLGRVALTGQPIRLEEYVPERECWLDIAAYSPAKNQFVTIFSDVTARRTAELKRENILSTALDGFCEIDAKGRFVDVNEVYCRMSGYSRDELLAMHAMEVESKTSLEEMLRRMEHTQRAGADRLETLNRHKDGHLFPVEISTRYVPGGGGRYFSFVRDITERTRAEETLRLRTQELKEAQRLARIGSSLRDLETDVIVWSDELYRIFGMDSKLPPPGYEEFWQFFAAESRTRLQAAAADFRREGRAFDLELEIVRRDGATRWITYRAEAERNASGKAVRFRTIIQDITERWLAERALRESEEKYRRIVDTMTEGVWMIDSDNCVSFVNPQAASMLGYRAEEIQGRSVFDFMDEENTAAVRIRLENRRRGIAEQFDLSLVAKNGRNIRVLLNTCPLRDANGSYAGSLGIATDITERTMLEEQLRQARKLESIGRLAGGVAHDFNNLLTVINGYSELLLKKLETGDPMHTPLAQINEAGQQAAALTQQLLAFSRKQITRPKALDLNQAIREIAGILHRLIGEDIDFNTRLSPQLELVWADPAQISQVLMNLVVNARDAMPGGGHLLIETRNVDLDEDYSREHPEVEPGPYVQLTVSDSGTGMDMETQEHLFEPFFTTKKPGEGTGLGLATVYGVVKQAGGSIWVYTVLGKGTTFKIYLPRLKEGAAAEALAKPAVEALQGTETILLVEDQLQLRRLARTVLQSYGYQVLEAANGAEAMACSERCPGPIHLMLTDVIMPGMSGRELADHLKPARPGMKVLFMSGYTEGAIVHHGILDADVAYLQKPVSADNLAAKVREVLGAPGPAATA
jgi:PAS domain S-box-containing protein